MGFWGFELQYIVFTIFSLPLYQGLAKEKIRCEERSYIEALQNVFLLTSVERPLNQRSAPRNESEGLARGVLVEQQLKFSNYLFHFFRLLFSFGH